MNYDKLSCYVCRKETIHIVDGASRGLKPGEITAFGYCKECGKRGTWVSHPLE